MVITPSIPCGLLFSSPRRLKKAESDSRGLRISVADLEERVSAGDRRCQSLSSRLKAEEHESGNLRMQLEECLAQTSRGVPIHPPHSGPQQLPSDKDLNTALASEAVLRREVSSLQAELRSSKQALAQAAEDQVLLEAATENQASRLR